MIKRDCKIAEFHPRHKGAFIVTSGGGDAQPQENTGPLGNGGSEWTRAETRGASEGAEGHGVRPMKAPEKGVYTCLSSQEGKGSDADIRNESWMDARQFVESGGSQNPKGSVDNDDLTGLSLRRNL